MTQKKTLDEKMNSFSLRKTAASLGHYDNVPSPAPATATDQDDEGKGYTRFNFICDKGIVRKVKDISRIEGISIRKIMEKALSEWLTKYEGKNGPVEQMRVRSIEEL
jgi:hypothetical protein